MLRTDIQDVNDGYILVLTAGILFIVIFGNNMAGWRHNDCLKNSLRKKYFMRVNYLKYANVLPKIASISMEHSAITQTNNSAASQIVDNLQLKILTKRPPLFFINFNTDPPLFSAAVPTHPRYELGDDPPPIRAATLWSQVMNGHELGRGERS